MGRLIDEKGKVRWLSARMDTPSEQGFIGRPGGTTKKISSLTPTTSHWPSEPKKCNSFPRSWTRPVTCPFKYPITGFAIPSDREVPKSHGCCREREKLPKFDVSASKRADKIKYTGVAVAVKRASEANVRAIAWNIEA